MEFRVGEDKRSVEGVETGMQIIRGREKKIMGRGIE